jgi:NAD(P)-dependent dehydrogenase (short-subunit alcohol dehydrogenase family)
LHFLSNPHQITNERLNYPKPNGEILKMEISGHAAIITGGASGLGRATALRLKAAGANVAACDLSFTDNNVVDDDGILCLRTDVTSEDSVMEALTNATDAHGTARILVNCAGILESQRVLGRDGVMPLANFRRLIDVHLVGTFNVIRLFADAAHNLDPITADGERGVIVNTASVAALEGQIGAVSYSAAKAGIAGMTLPLAREMAREGIRVVAIAPGMFGTPMVSGLSDKAQDRIKADIPFPNRMGEPDEYAKLVQQICENSMLNGEIIRLDAAIRMS